MKNVSKLVALAAVSFSSLAMATSPVAEKEINERLYPGDRHVEVVQLSGVTFVKSVDLISDWWQKRPTEIRVYASANGEKAELIGFNQFLSYDSNNCGPDFESKCSYPDAPKSKLSVPVNRNTDSVYVEIEGLLSMPNEFAILDKLIVQ